MADPKLRVRASGQGGAGYAIPTRPDENGKPLIVPGVTTVLKTLDKPALQQWSADVVAADAAVRLESLLDHTTEERYNSLRWGATYEAKRRAAIGTNVHEWIESWVNDDFIKPELETDEAAQCVDEFLKWEKDSGFTWLVAEQTVFNPVGYAGTLDIVGVRDGVTYVVDIKTGKNIYDESWMQQAALVKAPIWMDEVESGAEHKGSFFEETEPMAQIDSAMILHLRYATDEHDPFCSEYIIPDLDVYYEGFLACLEMTKMVYKMKKIGV